MSSPAAGPGGAGENAGPRALGRRGREGDPIQAEPRVEAAGRNGPWLLLPAGLGRPIAERGAYLVARYAAGRGKISLAARPVARATATARVYAAKVLCF